MSSFIWYELMTTDPDMAAVFYGAVIGWKFTSAPPGGQDYRMLLRNDGGSAGGMLKITPEMAAGGCRPAWLPYLHVADFDTALAAMVADGATVLVPRTEIPQGTWAMINDPQGVPIYVMKPKPPEGQPDAKSDVYSRRGAQRAAWNELGSPDLAGSKAFYARHFGFEFNDVMNMGPMGDYCFIDQDGEQIGAIMPQMGTSHPPIWQQYFRVPSIVVAKAAIEAGGGTIAMGPQEVPGGEHVIMALDPQGAGFGVVAAGKD